MKTTMLVVALCLWLSCEVGAVQRQLRANWDTYADTSATALQLYYNETSPSEVGMVPIDDAIPVSYVSLEFALDVVPRDTVWFGLRAINEDAPVEGGARYSDFYEWVAWVYPGQPPSAPLGLTITDITP